MDGASKCCPAMAVPMTVKMPEPMTAPMPRAVSDQGPSVFLRECSGCSESLSSLSIDLRAKSWEGRIDLLVAHARGALPTAYNPLPRKGGSSCGVPEAERLAPEEGEKRKGAAGSARNAAAGRRLGSSGA